MTRHNSFKRRIRARMAKTGESYAAARRALLAKATPAASPRSPARDRRFDPGWTPADHGVGRFGAGGDRPRLGRVVHAA